MLTPEDRREIKEEIKRQVEIVLSGQSGANDNKKWIEDIQNLYPGMPTIADRPVMHPYGFASRAIPNVIQVTARQGDHMGNRIVLGHRDSKRPPINIGEACLYSATGQKIIVGLLKNQIGSENADEPLVLGNVMASAISDLITQINNALTVIAAGPIAISSAPGNFAPTNPAVTVALTSIQTALTALVTLYVTNPVTNIKSLTNFTERGV